MSNVNSPDVSNSSFGNMFVHMPVKASVSPRLIETATSNNTHSQTDGIPELKRYHCLNEVLLRQGMSISHCSKLMGISLEEAQRQVDPQCNLTLSQLAAWSKALEVPVSEILNWESEISDPIHNRALLLRIVKTARQLEALSRNTRLEFATTTLVDQLLELIPEFDAVEPWPAIGKSRAARNDGLDVTSLDSELLRFVEEYS